MDISIIPQPVKVTQGHGRFVLGETTSIVVANEALRGVGLALRALLAPAMGFALPLVDAAQEQGKAIVLALAPERSDLGAEGYTLSVSPERIDLCAPAAAGVFYATQTLRQLLPAAIEQRAPVPGVEWAVPCLEIVDQPRFSWRGYMLDEGRYFHGKETVKRLLDLMALHKLNRFHWHLTEDQGWRIAIARYPRLVEVGSRRPATRIGFLGQADDGTPHGGYYTQEEIREIVAYAAERCITVVPEIEMPGHALAALAAYPELSCTGGPFAVSTRFGIHPDIFCAGKEAVFTFLQDVLDEVMALFPSRAIHVGGDEAPKRRWKACPDCRARMRQEGLANVHDLQGYMTNRVARYLAAHGRRLVGWNQILNDGLDAGAICQYWMGGLERVLRHARRGRDVVMSAWRSAYLDHSYAFTPLSRAYAYDPVPERLEPAHHARILGLEAPLWCEFVPNLPRLDWQTWPRLAAFAETGWTPRAGKDWDSFQARLAAFLPRLDALGVGYALPEEVEPGWLRRLFSWWTIVQPQTGTRQDRNRVFDKNPVS